MLSLVSELASHPPRPVREILLHDLALAQQIQSAFRPRTLPRDAQLEMAARSLPSRLLTGDFYDYLPVDSRRFGVALGDVTGKGLPAALLAAQLQALLRAGLAAGLPQVAALLNAHLLSLGDQARCATLFCGLYDRRSDRLQYVNAGHNPPILLRRDGACERLETGGILLGAFPGVRHQRGVVELRAGDCLLVYSDGLTETFAPDGEAYGEARVRAALRRSRGRDAEEILRLLEAEATAFRGEEDAQDDLTLLVLRKP